MCSLLSLFLLLTLFGASLGTCKYKFIHDASELIEFSNDVNDGTNYASCTVYLAGDIVFDEELSKSFEPIGKTDSKNFIGTFDGQGYVIRNLTLSSSSYKYTALFGYSAGTTIQNVVIDDSCSFSSYFYSSDYGYVTSILGRGYTSKELFILKTV